MILDERLEFFDGIAIPTSAGTALLGDVIDQQALGNAAAGLGQARDIGMGRDMWWYANVDVTATGGTSVQLQFVSSAAATLTSPVIHATSTVTVLANLTAGNTFVMIPVPAEGPAYLRYVGIIAVVAGTFVLGNISSGLMLDPKGWQAYNDAVN